MKNLTLTLFLSMTFMTSYSQIGAAIFDKYLCNGFTMWIKQDAIGHGGEVVIVPDVINDSTFVKYKASINYIPTDLNGEGHIMQQAYIDTKGDKRFDYYVTAVASEVDSCIVHLMVGWAEGETVNEPQTVRMMQHTPLTRKEYNNQTKNAVIYRKEKN